MESMTDIFDQDVQGGGDTDDLDADLVNASLVLQKVAADEGIDLSSLSDQDVADLLVDMLPHEKVASLSTPAEQPQQQKEASQMTTENTPEITIADVTMELSKIAAAEGVDLSALSREEVAQAFDTLASRMADGSYFESKVAADEEAMKIAEAREYGKNMAEGFLDRLKVAEDEAPPFAKKEDKKDDDKGEKSEDKDKDEEKKAAAMDHVRRLAGAAKSVAGKADKAVQKGGEKLLNRVGAGAEKASPAAKRAVALGAGGAATGAAGAGAAGVHHMSKKSLDEQAYEVAADLLRENGIDPETGNKLASEDVDAEKVAERAVELLREAGYQI